MSRLSVHAADLFQIPSTFTARQIADRILGDATELARPASACDASRGLVGDMTYLTKSRYAAGQQCHKRLWQACHASAGQAPSDGYAAAGISVGELARGLFPSGILVDQGIDGIAGAVQRTKTAMAKRQAALFEATIASGRLLARLDILEPLPGGSWGIREVKAAGEPNDDHLADLAFQLLVCRHAGLNIQSAELIHIDKTYSRGDEGIVVNKLFKRVELLTEITPIADQMERQVEALVAVMDRAQTPRVKPGLHCRKPQHCEFEADCTKKYGEDWLLNLPRISQSRATELLAQGIHRIQDIPAEVSLTPSQTIIRDAHQRNKAFISPGLPDALTTFGPPAYYLDFETMAPAIPLYQGTRPYQRLAFQWSLHHVGKDGAELHQEFLASESADPRPDFLESLIAALDGSNTPIIVYSSFEAATLSMLAKDFPHKARAIEAIIARFCDLLPVISKHYYRPEFQYSFSIKSVAPVLAQDVSYDNLESIADGGGAANAFERLASGAITNPAETSHLRAALLKYCHLDTLALVRVHASLRGLLS